MCGGGGAPEVKESEAERAQAREAGKRFLEWKDDGYEQLEKDSLAEAHRDISGKLKARANADVEQSAKGLSVGDPLQAAALGAGLSSAKRQSFQDADQLADGYSLDKRIAMAKVGQNVQGVQAQALGDLANMGASTARTNAQIELDKSLRRSTALGEALGTGLAGYAMYNGTPDGTGLGRVDNRMDRASSGHIIAGGRAIALPR